MGLLSKLVLLEVRKLNIRDKFAFCLFYKLENRFGLGGVMAEEKTVLCRGNNVFSIGTGSQIWSIYQDIVEFFESGRDQGDDVHLFHLCEVVCRPDIQ